MCNPLRVSLPRVLTLAFLACLCVAVPAQARQYMTPAFLAKTPRPMSLAILPPHAEFIKKQAVMTAEMVKEAQALEDEGAAALGAQLQAKGYTVRILTQKDVEETPGLKALVTTLNGRYDEEWGKILRKPREVKKGRYSVGEDAVKVCSLLKVDGLVVSRVVAVAHSGGRQALSIILTGAAAQDYARIGLSVLEGKAGHVEGYFEGLKRCTMSALLNKQAKVMGDAVEDAIDRYPAAAEIKIVKNAPQAAEADADADDKEKPDDAAISDFEAALKGKESKPPAPELPAAETPPPAPPPAPETQPSSSP